METPARSLEQKPKSGSPSRDSPSDLEIIEIDDSPVKRSGSPKSSVKKRKPVTKPEVQMAPMFSQIATASSSTSSGQQLKRKRSSADEPAIKASTREDRSFGHSNPSAGQASGTGGPRVDPLKAVQP